MKLEFGKYKGEELCDISDVSYLEWLEEQSWIERGLRVALQHELLRRKGDVSSLGRVVPSNE